MKTLIITLTIIFSFSIAQAKDIQLLNPDFFGKPTLSAIRLLYDKKSDEIEPYMVTADIKCGKYYAASVYYSKKVAFADARESLNKMYKGKENLSLFEESKMACWRVEGEKLSIQLTQEDYGVCIRYIQFQPTKVIFKEMMKAMGADTDALDDKECQ